MDFMDSNLEGILDRCLAAFVGAGTLDLSLDKLAAGVGVSKRMLIHYFGGKAAIEELATERLEERLRAQFRVDAFLPRASLADVVAALWERTTRPESRGVLLLVMDLNRRAWNSSQAGSDRARAFYLEQQRLWVDLLLEFSPDRELVESVLQLFQGLVLAFLVSGDADRGRKALERYLSIVERHDRAEI